MICASSRDVRGPDAATPSNPHGSPVSPIGMLSRGIFVRVYFFAGSRVILCITPNTVLLWSTRDGGGIVIHDLLTLKNDSPKAPDVRGRSS